MLRRAKAHLRRKHQMTTEHATKNPLNHIQYRGFSIELELDGTWSVYRFGYVSGKHTSAQQAKLDINMRAD
jgi:hypothetical protein